MFGVEDITRTRVDEAREFGMRSQSIHNSKGENPKSATRRLMETIAKVMLLAITLIIFLWK
jgi:hypothetical protein